MTKIVFFIESNNWEWMTIEKIGKLFMNRLAIDEDATIEILKIFELESYGEFEEDEIALKLMTDFKMFENGIKSLIDFGNDGLVPHFIYCGDNEFTDRKDWHGVTMVSFLMKHYKISSLVFTILFMRRQNLITKEELEQAYSGKLRSTEDWKRETLSVNEDLELFLMELVQNHGLTKSQVSNSFFTPKLSQEELDLVEQGNIDYLNSFYDFGNGFDPDVDPEEMLKSDSKNKYLHANCWRKTVRLTLAKDVLDDADPNELVKAREWLANAFTEAKKSRRRAELWQYSKVLSILFLLLPYFYIYLKLAY